jgi:hypothetical protein
MKKCSLCLQEVEEDAEQDATIDYVYLMNGRVICAGCMLILQEYMKSREGIGYWMQKHSSEVLMIFMFMMAIFVVGLLVMIGFWVF